MNQLKQSSQPVSTFNAANGVYGTTANYTGSFFDI